jgi:hypothetical protein
MSRLRQELRQFWYDNEPGEFEFDIVAGKKRVSRTQIQKYGGPSRDFDGCEYCQRSEWASRLVRTDLFLRHTCKTSGTCSGVCKKQGSEFWTNWHQDFTFSIGCDESLGAPRCLFLAPQGKWKLWERFHGHRCDHAMLNLKRQLAQSCQVRPVQSLDGVKLSKYDFLLMQCTGDNPPPPKNFDLPVVMIGWDFWNGKEMYQKEIDQWQPDFFLSSALCGWREHLNWPEHTEFRFYHAASPGAFFARPNLDFDSKPIDLLVIGDIYGGHGLYDARVELDRQIQAMRPDFNIEYSHLRGGGRFVFEGPTEFLSGQIHREFTTGVDVTTRWPFSEPVRLLNKWSEYIGRAKYVIFGPMNIEPQIVIRKHYECLASGAIPIMPESPDLEHLGLAPMVHYIPLKDVWNNTGYLKYLLRFPEMFTLIADNAVDWHEKNADRLIFDGFEDVVREVTNNWYPERLVE